MTTKEPATVADLLKTPKDGQKYELVDGEIVVSPTGRRHGKVALKISHIIATSWKTTQPEKFTVLMLDSSFRMTISDHQMSFSFERKNCR
jgi:hypothetical protein